MSYELRSYTWCVFVHKIDGPTAFNLSMFCQLQL